MRTVSKPRHHAALAETVSFDLILTCRTGLHIGAGKSQDLTGTDLPILRDARAEPMIPGSSLRGVLRSGIEALCAAAGINAPPGEAEDSSEEAARFHGLWTRLSPVERLFGHVETDHRRRSEQVQAYGSRLYISDLHCREERASVALRDGVAISRETRTAAGGALFDFEVVAAGTSFRGRVRLLNPDPYEIGLLAQALWMLDEGVLLLGGKKARGLGWVQVAVTEPRSQSAKDILKRVSHEELHENPGTVSDKMAAALTELRAFIGKEG